MFVLVLFMFLQESYLMMRMWHLFSHKLFIFRIYVISLCLTDMNVSVSYYHIKPNKIKHMTLCQETAISSYDSQLEKLIDIAAIFSLVFRFEMMIKQLFQSFSHTQSKEPVINIVTYWLAHRRWWDSLLKVLRVSDRTFSASEMFPLMKKQKPQQQR